MEESKYYIGDAGFAQTIIDKYLPQGIRNLGAVRYSNDETQVLFEQYPSNIEQEDQDLATHILTREEAIQYLKDNEADWSQELDL